MSGTPYTEQDEEQWSCGKGLAEHAVVPAGIASYLKSLAENLEAHLPTIDVKDVNGRRERDAYQHLVSEYSEMADRLAIAAEQMGRYRDLPLAQHHEEALSDPKILEAFGRLVAVEADLANLLRISADRDQSLFREWEGSEE